ncbi:MAG TPA: PQQ-binding-like beta-propeller repeat protein [Gaiellaceae bacterium]|nr:PQQ-binding-like beta-propeller repeat protein [Gaiellaceae bacterium]HVC86589.1 PQQ-binding-like beta-propeller repeat protein [Gaiellaceae bacterium]
MRWRLAACGVVLVAGFLAACGTPHHKVSKPPVTKPAPPKQNESLPWPTYGVDNARTRAVTAPGLRPPFRRLWTFYGHALLELPPVAGYGLLYEEDFNGRISAIDPKTGKVQWRYDSRRCGWSSPALAGGLVFATFIGNSSCPRAQLSNGELVALDARTGRIRWQRTIGDSESSPLVAHGTVYFGDTDGHVYAFAAATGRERWSFDAGGAVKGSPALEHGRLYVGNYGGSFYILSARTGHLLWQNGGHGNFYAGASIADGRVYVGSIDGHVYGFSARNLKTLWAFPTGGWVYASTAVWRGIVLVGSYDHNFYAINAASGSERWAFPADGPISGAASVINGIVYFSTLGHPGTTYAVSALTGHLIEKWNDGDYSPAIAADGRLFLIGLGRIYALEPR